MYSGLGEAIKKAQGEKMEPETAMTKLQKASKMQKQIDRMNKKVLEIIEEKNLLRENLEKLLTEIQQEGKAI